MSNKYLKTPPITGTRVPHYKNTENCSTEALISPPSVTLLMSQHLGAPADPCVSKGDTVYVGTVVGTANGFVSADIHSSVSGKVKDVVKYMMAGGQQTMAVIVESDGEFTPDPSICKPVVNTKEDLINAVAKSGIVGLGGAGFPTHVKLSPPKTAEIDTLIINAAECEPYITSDYRGMIENPESVINGISLVKRLLDIPRAVIGIENNKMQAVELLKPLAQKENIEIKVLGSTYPQGAEKVLIANITGRAVPAGKLPADAGVIVLNVGTVASIYDYLQTGMPLVKKRITLDGDVVSHPCNIWVPVGTSVRFLIEQCCGLTGEAKKILMGGPMMGVALYTDDYPVQKNSNAVLAFGKVSLTQNNPCIHCGRCIEACTMKLSPAEIQMLYEQKDLEAAQALSVMSCIECGCCTYVCPAKRPITQIMRLTKLEIRKAGTKK